jgi:ankyrin repeat protein
MGNVNKKLLWGAEVNDFEEVKSALSSGANVNAQKPPSETKCGSAPSFHHYGCSCSCTHQVSSDQETALILCAKQRCYSETMQAENEAILDLLLSHSADVTITDVHGNTALLVALLKGKSDRVALKLIKADVKRVTINEGVRNGRFTPIIEAARNCETEDSGDHIGVLKALLDAGADTSDGRAIRAAIEAYEANRFQSGEPKGPGCVAGKIIAEHRRSRGEEIVSRDALQRTLCDAVGVDDLELVKILSVGADSDALASALLEAAGLGFVGLVTYFLTEKGVPIDAADDKSRTALYYAAQHCSDNTAGPGCEDVVRLLVERGASSDCLHVRPHHPYGDDDSLVEELRVKTDPNRCNLWQEQRERVARVLALV